MRLPEQTVPLSVITSRLANAAYRLIRARVNHEAALDESEAPSNGLGDFERKRFARRANTVRIEELNQQLAGIDYAFRSAIGPRSESTRDLYERYEARKRSAVIGNKKTRDDGAVHIVH